MECEISESEALAVNVMRMNQAEKRREIRRKVELGRFRLGFTWRSSKNTWGRFGGGWNWKLGFSAGGSTIFLHLLIADIWFAVKKPT